MLNTFTVWDDTIVALATPPGIGAIAVIRLSGEQSIAIARALIKGNDLLHKASNTLHVGMLKTDGEELDEVIAPAGAGDGRNYKPHSPPSSTPSILARNDPGVLADAHHVEEHSHQTVQVDELHHPPLALLLGSPVEH